MQENVKKQLKYCGQGVKIYPWAKIVSPETVSIGDWSQIDDFTLIIGGKGINIGKRVHVAGFSSIIGRGECVLSDYSGLSAGVRIITGGDDFMGGGMTNPCIPLEFRKFRNLDRSFVVLEKHALLGTNVVVLPGVTIS